MSHFFEAFFRDEDGLTMVEYAIAGGLLAAATAAAFTGLGTAIITRINALATTVTTGN